MTTQVLVAGGGSAGLAAAVVAARAGAETLLIERGGMLGGMGTAALVHTICGLYEIRDEPGAVWANDGFPREFAERLQRSGGARGPVRMGRVDVLLHDPVAFAALADALVAETPNLRVWMHAEIVAAQRESVEIICRGRRETIHAQSFVDATGDATLTKLAGADFQQTEPDHLQRPAYIAQLRGLPAGYFEEAGRLRLAHAIAAAVKSGALPVEALGAGFRAGVRGDEAFLTIDLAAGGGAWEPDSPEALAGVESTGRRTALAIVQFLQSDVPGCAVAAWPARAGVRESRRICGVYELTDDDVLTGAQFPDAIAAVAWPMELRERATGPRWRYAERAAQIPLRALRHRDVENLWCAGRCISATHSAQAAIRVMGTCLATGEAAGLAAVEAPSQDWPELAARVIQRRAALSHP